MNRSTARSRNFWLLWRDAHFAHGSAIGDKLVGSWIYLLFNSFSTSLSSPSFFPLWSSLLLKTLVSTHRLIAASLPNLFPLFCRLFAHNNVKYHVGLLFKLLIHDVIASYHTHKLTKTSSKQRSMLTQQCLLAQCLIIITLKITVTMNKTLCCYFVGALWN